MLFKISIYPFPFFFLNPFTPRKTHTKTKRLNYTTTYENYTTTLEPPEEFLQNEIIQISFINSSNPETRVKYILYISLYIYIYILKIHKIYTVYIL